MKLRLFKNSLRFRLTRSEVVQFSDTGSVEETLEFGGELQFRYRLIREDALGSAAATFDDGCITVAIPTADAIDWANTERVGIKAIQILDGGDSLTILVEKDFACLEPRAGTDDNDTFPNPLTCGSAVAKDAGST